MKCGVKLARNTPPKKYAAIIASSVREMATRCCHLHPTRESTLMATHSCHLEECYVRLNGFTPHAGSSRRPGRAGGSPRARRRDRRARALGLPRVPHGGG